MKLLGQTCDDSELPGQMPDLSQQRRTAQKRSLAEPRSHPAALIIESKRSG